MQILDISLSLVALIILELVLGIDNLVMLSILTEKLPTQQRKKAQRWGLTFAWMARLILLALAFHMVKLMQPIVTIGSLSLSFRDIFLIAGGGFLIWKATDEIHNEVMDDFEPPPKSKAISSSSHFKAVVIQLVLLDLVFSLDSVLTAVGLTQYFVVMAIAITFAIIVMIYASEPLTQFISNHPTIKILALSYLILIGMVLVADGLAFHIPRGYLYFAMGFSIGVESLNLSKKLRRQKRTKTKE